MSRSSVPYFRDVGEYERLRETLEKAGYTDKGVIEALGAKDSASLNSHDLPVLLRRTGEGTPLSILIRLFLMEVPVDRSVLEKEIPSSVIASWIDGKLLQGNANSVAATIRILPFEGFLVAFDRERRLFSRSGSGFVMGIGGSSLTLANHTIRKQARSTLDLGSGCGIQAILASTHSERVFAVDRNPRAVRFSEFNAKLNRLTHLRSRQGDLFEPVQGEKFDLIVSNPPFVISPDMRYIYRDSGMEGDKICESIVRQAPKLLNNGGFCQILCNWAERKGQDWRERLSEWFDGSGCDAWVMRSETQETAHYASMWIRHTERLQGENYARRFDEWMAYYERQGIEAVSSGFVTFRHAPDHKNWFRAEDGLGKRKAECGDAILRGFELTDYLIAHDDTALLQTRFRVSPDVRMEQQYVRSDGAWLGSTAKLSLAKGLDYVSEADPPIVKLISDCDGSRSLEQLFQEMTAPLGADAEKVMSPFIKLVRRFIESGFILPVEQE